MRSAFAISSRTIDIFNDDGTMSEAAELYIGKDRFEVRKEIMKDLEANGHMVKIEDYMNKVGILKGQMR